jgi:hypothetical protein
MAEMNRHFFGSSDDFQIGKMRRIHHLYDEINFIILPSPFPVMTYAFSEERD